MTAAILKPPFPRLQRGRGLARGLVAAWPAYEGSGAILHDVTGNRFDGTLHGGATWTGGRAGSCLKCDGASGYVSMTSPLGASITQYTQAAWLNSGVTGNVALSFGDAGQLWIGNFTGGRWNANAANGVIVSSTQNATGGWHHILAKYDGSALSIYVDGSFSNNVGYSSSVDGSGNGYIGNYQGSALYWNGLIDDVRIWNRALSDAEIREISMGQG
ncbi:MAG TPA: LamG domain-containing protein [Stellaceae bacterium]|nr:LamG domain-containing protein [Stellaceae bacterium]